MRPKPPPDSSRDLTRPDRKRGAPRPASPQGGDAVSTDGGGPSVAPAGAASADGADGAGGPDGADGADGADDAGGVDSADSGSLTQGPGAIRISELEVGASDSSGRIAVGGYALGELLGRGGMGEVIEAFDGVIGRDVALKRMRSGGLDPEAESRFLREAKVQARLEHPAIVPVHELGRDELGRPYFTMKRLVGVTLAELLDEPPQRLLRALVEVCLAVEFAHERGVIHRDLKPSNIMLGDFGEVYVLDWGVARVLDDGSANPSVQDIAAVDGETQVGAVMGTPGYMAPEQALGYGIGPAVDVYALGCVLFEVLTGEPLHPRGTSGAVNAIANPTEAPSVRCPDRAIAPELDAACVAALAEDPEARPSARGLAQRIQDYLDGDRDLERRRKLAAVQLGLAREALASADPARRGAAVHAAGRALALDPESTDAADLVASLIVEPPHVLPPALEASLRDADRAAARVRARTATLAFVAVLPFIAIVPFVEVKSWPLLAGFFASMAGMAIVSWLSYRRGAQIAWVSLATTFVATLFASRLIGPWVLSPVVVGGIALGLTAIPTLQARPWWLIAWIAAAIAAPVVLEVTGVFERTWWYDGHTLVVRSLVFHGIDRTIETIALVVTHVAFIAMASVFSRATMRDRRAAERRLHVQAWHLQQLLPRRPTR